MSYRAPGASLRLHMRESLLKQTIIELFQKESSRRANQESIFLQIGSEEHISLFIIGFFNWLTQEFHVPIQIPYFQSEE